MQDLGGCLSVFQEIQEEHLVLEKHHYNIFGYYKLTYRFQGTLYNFQVSLDRENEINISLMNLDLEKHKEKRYAASFIANKLLNALETSPKYRLKFLVNKMSTTFSQDKYLILDPENFENRKKETFVKERSGQIEKIFRSTMKEAKSSKSRFEYFLVIKEDDEFPLMDFLLEKNMARKIATLNEEEYLKINASFNFDELFFYSKLAEEMETFGYNLYYEQYLGNDDYYYYDDYDDYYYDWEEIAYEHYYPKKQKVKVKDKRKNKKRIEFK